MHAPRRDTIARTMSHSQIRNSTRGRLPEKEGNRIQDESNPVAEVG